MRYFVFLFLVTINCTFAEQLRFVNLEQRNLPSINRIKVITQDHTGFIWIGTSNQLLRYDGFELKVFNQAFETTDDITPNEILHLNVDKENNLLISTKHNGLFRFNGLSSQNLRPNRFVNNNINNQVSTTLIDHDEIWLALDGGLGLTDKDNGLSYFPIPKEFKSEDDTVKNIEKINGKTLLLSTRNQLFYFDTTVKQFSLIHQNNDKNFYIHDLFKDSNDQVWISTEVGLFQLNNNDLDLFDLGIENVRASEIIEAKDFYWLASLGQGLFRISKYGNEHIQYLHHAGKANSLPNNFIKSIYQDSQGLVWLGSFNGSVSLFDPSTLNFEIYNQLNINPECTQSDSFFDIIPLSKKEVLIKSGSHLFRLNKKSTDCQKITFNTLSNDNQTDHRILKAINLGDTVLVFTKKGISQLESNGSLTQLVAHQFVAVYHAKKINNEEIYIGTNRGLEKYNITTKAFSKFSSDSNELGTARFYNSVKINDKQTVFATNKGLLTINPSGQLEVFAMLNTQKPLDTISIFKRGSNEIWVGTYKNGILVLDINGKVLKHHTSINSYTNFSAYSIIDDSEGNIWIGGDIGIIRFDFKTETFDVFTETEGAQGPFFNINSIAKSEEGQIYMGGRNGLNIFDPDSVKPNPFNGQPVLTDLRLFNRPFDYKNTNNQLGISQSIEKIKHITFSHNDYIFSLAFSALEFLDPQNIEYAYKLDGFDLDWNDVSNSTRLATYTNLPSGDYTFRFRAKEKSSAWPGQANSLKISVLPPPWLTWWAISIYIVLISCSIYWYIQRKTKINRAIADQLRIEVAEKTKELNAQKQTVESLLAKKNDLFSNVSHEFRTPLTLILGPIKELINKQVDQENTRSLKMINRSANRLLSLVEQLLQIARVSNIEQVKTSPQNTQRQIASLIDSFQYLAKSKHIELNLKHNDQATIDVTDQFIDAVLGNLVSNAIKYTQAGGHVSVNARRTGDALVLSIKDTGTGLTAEQQKDIFKRFKRLDSHQSIEGIGIGLSVVEEVVKINNGEIQVESELGVGSKFTVRIPLVEAIEQIESTTISTLVEQLQSQSLEATEEPALEIELSEDSSLNTVLVIEDNHDMREHIVSIVTPHYNCLTAENGVKGVSAAIKEIPDIIISDVMMPEMDGFKVARIIRSDQRTSHIPLMLLTALNNKTSRIKGWREHVDAYMTKPFDRDELLVQLENMLTIRDILKKKAGQQISSGKKTSGVLPKKDQEFVDKLIQIIESNYMDPILNRAKIASKMAVSDRQLQRKSKALIDQNPMDMLREHRLNKSKEFLKDGYQVSIVADSCGFNSVSYFSQCFKAQYGMSPKQYQQAK